MGASSWLTSDTTMVLSFQLPRSRAIPYSTLFENNSYLRMLNKLLQLELSLIDLYRRCSDCLERLDVEATVEAHRQQSRNLVNLIVYNRGIPEERGFNLTPEIGILAHGLGRHLGRTWAHRTSHAGCLHLERMLQRRYALALKEAPYGDRAILQDHSKRIGKNIEWLTGTNEELSLPT